VKQVRKFALGAISACLVALAPAASQAATIQLGFILDRSGSIGSSNWNTIVNGLSSAVGSLIPVGGDNTYEVSVVTFASSATANIQRVLVTDATARANLATQIAGLTSVYSGGGTCFSCAFSSMTTALQPTITGAAFSYVNFATDGVGDNGVAQRNALITAGVDNISIEGIGGGVDVGTLTGSYCYPQPCDTTSPYNFPSQGFYIGVADAAAYVAAIGNKIRVVTGQIPEPGTLALAGLALAGIAATARRRSA
jgi:hypothetical protein